MGYIKLTGSTNVHQNGTSEYVLEVDADTGEPTKVVRAGEPVQISAEDRKKLEGLGAVFTDSTAEESKDYEAEKAVTPQVGADVGAAAPLLGAGVVDQPVTKSKTN